MKKLILITAGFLISLITALAQPTGFSVDPDPNLQIVTDMIQTGSGNFIIAGTDKNHSLVCITSLSDEGEILWSRYLNGDMEWFANISEKSNGNILIPMHHYYALLTELNPMGDSVNSIYITETNQSLFSSVIEMNDSLLVAAEMIRNSDPLFPDYDSSILVKMDGELNIIEKIPAQFRLLMCLTKISDNEFFSLANHYTYAGSYFTKFDQDGVILTSNACTAPSDSFFQHRMYRLNGNNLIAAGTQEGGLFQHAGLSKFDLGGNIEYCNSYDLPYFISVANDESLEYIYAMGNENTDCRIYKLDYAGNQLSVYTLNDSLYGNNIIYRSGSLYIAGNYNPVGSNPGSRFIKLNVDSFFSIAEKAIRQTVKVYPNPATAYVIFEIPSNNHPMTRSLPDGKAGHRMNSEITIMNIFGQEVARKEITSGKTVWDCRDMEQGIYIYKIGIKGLTVAGKIVIK